MNTFQLFPICTKPLPPMLLACAGIATMAALGSAWASGPAPTAIAAKSRSMSVPIDPFTHAALIPASANVHSIRFESLKVTKVFTQKRETQDRDYCQELQFRDPGGSMFCPSVHWESPAPAYEVNYAYSDSALASGKNSGNFTFQVYFRPEELSPELRSRIGKAGRSELASYFDVTTSRPMERTTAIDDANSTFCAGNYIDGSWVNGDPSCRDRIHLETVNVPSDYIAVDVELRPDKT